MPNYSLGKIYKIVNDVNDKIYIGSTCQTLSQRLNGHRKDARKIERMSPLYSAMKELGIGQFRIVLIEEYPCQNVAQLTAREYTLMGEVKANGVELYNDMINGCHSEETREKMRGRVMSEETRQKLRDKVVSDATRTKMRMSFRKRGCLFYYKKCNRWSFSLQEDGKQRAKVFSANKYGADGAHGLALYWQEEIYPLVREDDSELIREIRARAEA